MIFFSLVLLLHLRSFSTRIISHFYLFVFIDHNNLLFIIFWGSYSENSFTKKQLVRFLCLLWFLDLWTAWFSLMGIKFEKRSQENVSLILTNSSHQTVAHHHLIKKFVSRPLIWDKSLGKLVYWTIFLEMFRSHCHHLPLSEICLVVSWTKCLMYFTIFRPSLRQRRFVSWAKETNLLVGA